MEKAPKHMAFLVIPNATLLDITGPYEAFSLAAQCLKASGRNACQLESRSYEKIT